MDWGTFAQSTLFQWIILPVLIFVSRIFDVSIGTVRIMVVSRGAKFLAPLLGFFEVTIWLLAIGQIMRNLNNPLCYLAYAGGFAMGNFIGILIEEKLAVGKRTIRIITPDDAPVLVRVLRQKGFGVTSLPAMGDKGPVQVILTVVDRKDVDRVVAVVQRFNPKIFYSIEDARMVGSGVFPRRKHPLSQKFSRPPRWLRRLRIWRLRTHDKASFSRRFRLRIALALFVVVPLGFLTKTSWPVAGSWMNNFGGGIVYEWFWCLAALWVWPALSEWVVAGAVFGLTSALECLQLWHPPFLEAVRNTFLGHALLGSVFSGLDFLHYAFGCVLAAFWIRVAIRRPLEKSMKKVSG